MARDPRRRAGVRTRVASVLAAAALLTAGMVAHKPWTDSVMTATIALATDEGGTVAEKNVRLRFRARDAGKAVVTREFDLSRWEGQLVRLDVGGHIGARGLAEGATGHVACAAEFVDEKEETPLEFVSWQEGMRRGLHPRSTGPRAYRLDVAADDSFAFAMTGTLWHVFRVPEAARLRVRLKPLPALELSCRPAPCVPDPSPKPGLLVGRRLASADAPPDLFIYMIDSLRADHLGCYGYGRGTSPVIDAFAAGATLYEQAHTPATWTRPSVATMLTGLYPSVHRTMHMEDGLAEWPVLLPEILNEAGYVTRCISANWNVTERMGFDQGYDEFAFLPWATAELLNETVRRRLEREDPSQPVFMLVHTMEPHGPYTPPPQYRRRFDRGIEGDCDGSSEGLNALPYVHPGLSEEDYEHLIDLYDAEVYQADRGFAMFLQTLKHTGRYENSLIVLVSDHGEAFGEHDTRAHGFDLNQETMQVVLVVRFPEGRHEGRRVQAPVSLVDVVPTALAETGARTALPYTLPGSSLAHAALLPNSDSSRRIFAEVARLGSGSLDLVGVIDEDGYKRVIDVSMPPRETAARKSLGLWDAKRDPSERVDLSDRMPVRAAYGEQLISRWLVEQERWLGELEPERPPRVELLAQERKQLEALGYLGDDR